MTAPRNATSFIIEKMEWPGKPGAVLPVYHPDTKALMGINHGCPCGCGMWSWLRVNNSDCPTFQKWDIQGQSADVLHLTLTPSIGINPKDASGRYHWHGYLKNGVFEEG